MVKIKLSVSKKKYLRKCIYEYIRVHWPIPKKMLTKLESFQKEDFRVEFAENESEVTVKYIFSKKPENPPAKVEFHNLFKNKAR